MSHKGPVGVRPASSNNSRAAASCGVSPGSMCPPGTLQNPIIIPLARSNMRMCPSRKAYTPATSRYCFVQSCSTPPLLSIAPPITTPDIRRAEAFHAPILGSRPYAPSLSPWLDVSPPQPLQWASGSLPSLLQGARRRARAPLLTRLQNPSGRVYPKTLPARQENRCGESLESSSVFPLVEPPLFLPRHGTCRDWEALAVRKLDDHTEEIPASRWLAEDIIHRI